MFSCEEYASKAKVFFFFLDLMKTMWLLWSLATTVFFQPFDAQIKPMRQKYGNQRVSATEAAHLSACKRLLRVRIKTQSHIAYTDTGQYSLNIKSTISSLKYWLKL